MLHVHRNLHTCFSFGVLPPICGVFGFNASARLQKAHPFWVESRVRGVRLSDNKRKSLGRFNEQFGGAFYGYGKQETSYTQTRGKNGKRYSLTHHQKKILFFVLPLRVLRTIRCFLTARSLPASFTFLHLQRSQPPYRDLKQECVPAI